MSFEVGETEEPEVLESENDEPPSAPFRGRTTFYKTSVERVIVLHLVTCGLYAPFWFYRHWGVQKRACNLRGSPFWRALFSVFFVHRLFRRIDRGARFAGLSPRWNPGSQATLYVALGVTSGLLSRFASENLSIGLIAYLIGAANVIPLATAQSVANRARQGSDLRDHDDDE